MASVTVYETNNAQDDVVYIPIPFRVNINTANKDEIFKKMKAKASDIGVEFKEGEEIISPFNFNIEDNSEIYFKGWGDKPVSGLTKAHWTSTYKYIESMQYDYENSKVLNLIIEADKFDINVETPKVEYTYEPVIVEFDDSETYTPVFLEKT